MSDYPNPIRSECGCKVSWRTYATKADAEAAQQAAIEKRERRLQQGYDFGFQWPGTLTHNPDGTYTVVCP